MNVKEDESKIISIGGVHTRRSVTEVYNSDQTPATIDFDLPIECPCDWSATLKLHSWVYIIGGLTMDNDQLIHSSEVFRLKLDNDEYIVEKVASMNEEKSAFGAAVFCDALVVAGGCRDYEPLASVECYLPQNKEWKTLPSTKAKKYGNALVSCNGSLYDIGGMDGDNYFSSVQRLRGLNEEWEDAPHMQTQRAGFAAVTLAECIFVIGGRPGDDDATRTNTVEKYDPVSSEWSFVKEMNFARDGHAACVLNDKIYVVGGIDPQGKCVMQIECYDAEANTWSIVGETADNLWAHTLIVI